MNKEKELYEATVALDKVLVKILKEDALATIEAQKMLQVVFWWADKSLKDEKLLNEKQKLIEEAEVETKEAEVVN